MEKGWLFLLIVVIVCLPAIYIQAVTAYEKVPSFTTLIINIDHVKDSFTRTVHGSHIAASIAVAIGVLILFMVIHVERKVKAKASLV
jgi:ABC-type Fe3+ transport system permease subunit